MNARTCTLIGILLAAAALRSYHIGFESIWIDEIASLQFSTGRLAGRFDPPTDTLHAGGMDMTSLENARPWTAVWTSVQGDTHPPLYFLVLRTWRHIFGEGDIAARSLSVAFSMLGVLLLYDTARLLHGRALGLWAAAIMAAATPQIVFAQEARGYAMVGALILAAADALLRIEVRGASRRRLAALAAALLAALMTHYVAIPATMALALYAVLRLRGTPRRRAIGAMAAVAVLFIIAWGPAFWRQRDNFTSNLTWIADSSPGIVGRTLDRMATLPLHFFITPKRSDAASWVVRLGAFFYLSPLLLVRRRELLLWILLAAAIIGAAAVADVLQKRRSLEIVRYTAAAAPAAYALVAALGEGLRRKWLRHAVPASLLLSCLAAVPEAYNRYWKPDYRGFVAAFDRDAGPNDVIVVPFIAGYPQWYESLLLSATTHYSTTPNRPVLVITQQISAQPLQQLRAAPGVWWMSGVEYPIEQLLGDVNFGRLFAGPSTGTYVKIEFPAAADAPSP